jgi:hypothetical protein
VPLEPIGAVCRVRHPFTSMSLYYSQQSGAQSYLAATRSGGREIPVRAVEGMNNKIKSISHRSFGFRTAENFIAAIYHSCARLLLPAER